MNIQNVLNISSRLHAIQLGPRYQEITSLINFSILFYQLGMARAGPFSL